mmetsp:Transcript_49471/g.96771  ORF Transcript_49471/g.96771 Transcript_49471/m.96771 type:complete len:205 (-) Transcript_49471:149-763(-)
MPHPDAVVRGRALLLRREVPRRWQRSSRWKRTELTAKASSKSEIWTILSSRRRWKGGSSPRRGRNLSSWTALEPSTGAPRDTRASSIAPRAPRPFPRTNLRTTSSPFPGVPRGTARPPPNSSTGSNATRSSNGAAPSPPKRRRRAPRASRLSRRILRCGDSSGAWWNGATPAASWPMREIRCFTSAPICSSTRGRSCGSPCWSW